MSTAGESQDAGQDRTATERQGTRQEGAAGGPPSARHDGSGEAPPNPARDKLVDRISWGVLIGLPLISFALSYWNFGEGPSNEKIFGAFRDGVIRPQPMFPWAIVGEIAFVVYAYSVAIRNKEYRAVFVGLAVWLGEMIWEMVNGVWRHYYCFPWFGFDGHTAWQMYPGLTIEISLMFAVVPLVLFNLLPKYPKKRIWVFHSRILVPFLLSVLCIVVELWLNKSGALVWKWYYWKSPYVGVVMSSYYVPFLVMAFAHDWLKTKKVIYSFFALVAVILAFVICHFTLPHSKPLVESCTAAQGG